MKLLICREDLLPGHQECPHTLIAFNKFKKNVQREIKAVGSAEYYEYADIPARDSKHITIYPVKNKSVT